MPRRFPIELELEILEHAFPHIELGALTGPGDALFERRRLFRQLTLVHRDLTPQIRAEQYSELALTAPTTWAAVDAAKTRFERVKAMQGKIRVLSVAMHATSDRQADVEVGMIGAALGDMRDDVEALEVRFGKGDPSFILDLPNLRHLALVGQALMGEACEIASVPSTLSFLFLKKVVPQTLPSSFPHLTTLLLRKIDLDTNDLDNLLSLCPTLRTFGCIELYGRSFPSFLQDAPPSLRHLLIGVNDGHEAEPYAEAVTSLSIPLKSVTLVLSTADYVEDDAGTVFTKWCTARQVRGRIEYVDRLRDFDLAAWRP
ncbi:hypothetical protein JCM8547_008114 [Rhodosporidiobolus lusitaniae]